VSASTRTVAYRSGDLGVAPKDDRRTVPPTDARDEGFGRAFVQGGGVMKAVAAVRYVGKMLLALFVMVLVGALDW
jgi:hypothetical protein